MAESRQEPTEPDGNSEVVVRAVSTYRPEESDLSHATDKKYVFSYEIEIENRGTRTIQLMSRHWWITDARQAVREVEGEGVVGQHPVITPGQTFSYSSWCILPTASGWMRGVYSMAATGGATIEVPVPPFSLATPYALN
jgi:ApaG protein